MTRSGFAARISVAFDVQESATISRFRCSISGTTSEQYFVHATTRSSWPTLARITVALGWRQTIRCGPCEADIASIVGEENRASGIYNLAVYSPAVLDHFQNPRNAGDVESPDASAELENPACGDVLRLTVKVDAGRIADVRFRAKGCVSAIACGSALTELLMGRTLEEARQLCREELVRAVGGLPEASAHASHLAIDTLGSLLQKL